LKSLIGQSCLVNPLGSYVPSLWISVGRLSEGYGGNLARLEASAELHHKSPVMGIKRFDHETKVKARSKRRNLQAASQLCTKQVGTGEINQIIESLLKVKV